jgi:hypothetical protein
LFCLMCLWVRQGCNSSHTFPNRKDGIIKSEVNFYCVCFSLEKNYTRTATQDMRLCTGKN